MDEQKRLSIFVDILQINYYWGLLERIYDIPHIDEGGRTILSARGHEGSWRHERQIYLIDRIKEFVDTNFSKLEGLAETYWKKDQ